MWRAEREREREKPDGWFLGLEEEGRQYKRWNSSIIWELWTTILSVTGINWACPYMVKDLFCAWSQLPVKKTNIKLRWVVPLCVCWAI